MPISPWGPRRSAVVAASLLGLVLAWVLASALAVSPLAADGAAAAEALRSGRYTVRSSDSYVGYRIQKFGMVPVRGHFGQVAGEIVVDTAAPERSRASIRVPLTSLESGNPARTETLLSEDFFDATRHPEMSFVSRRVGRGQDGSWLVAGSLTIRGVSQTLTLPVELTPSEGVEGPVLVLSTSFEIDRTNFGVLGERWSGGRTLLSDTVEIEITLTAEGGGAS